MQYIAYTASIISIILGVLEPFGKKMQTVLILNFLGNFLVGISYFFSETESMAGAAVCFVACIQVIINFFFDRKSKKIPLYLILIYALSFLTVNLTVFSAWYDIFSIGATMIYVISMAQNNVGSYRILYALNSSCWILYDVLSASYAPLITHITLALFTFAAMFINRKKQS